MIGKMLVIRFRTSYTPFLLILLRFFPLRGRVCSMRSLDSWPRLVLLAVVLPAAYAALDWALLRGTPRNRGSVEIVVTYGVFVVQVALLAWLVGWGLKHPLLRWAVFVWTLLLINLSQITVIGSDQSWFGAAPILAYAMLSAQLSLAAVWGALGDMRWTWRLPIVLTAASVLGFFLLHVNEQAWTSWISSYDLWSMILLVQSAAALVACLAMNVAGYRIVTPNEDASPYDNLVSPGERRRQFQFSLKHLMIWMTAIGPAILILRALNVWMTTRYGLGQWIEILMLGLFLAALSLLAMWAAAGPEDASLRVSLFLTLAPVMGAVLGTLAVFGWWDRLWFLTQESGPTRVLYWSVWTTLAGYFFAGMMLIFRAEGRRLERLSSRR